MILRIRQFTSGRPLCFYPKPRLSDRVGVEEFNSHKPLPHALTAIFKAPVAGAVAIEELNLAGDQQADLATASGTVFESAAQVQQHANSSSLALYA